MQPQYTTPPERWRYVVGWEGWYEVSSLGRVRRAGKAGHGTYVGRILKPFRGGAGYSMMRLCRDSWEGRYYVHQLVALAFLDPCPPGYEMNHKDGCKGNNSTSNLEWLSHSENIAHAYRTGLKKPSAPRGQAHYRAKLTEADVRAIRAARGHVTGLELARRFAVSDRLISEVQLRRIWKHI